ncbi:glycosyltransferase [Amycolatopsis taiwanensis]|uniref:glycosyltransferase n=1 Tax=Amycolatopsis taiwanensis TaxID=342230 RepID=UPI002557116C|nr:glycosyltransferase [Amycolatopsis taiwanensis]
MLGQGVVTRVVIVSARVGAGHDGAACELARRFRERGMRVDRLDFLDLLPGRLGRILCGFYQRQLTVAPRSWDWLLALLGTRVIAGLARRFARLATPGLGEVIDRDVVLTVSTYPMATHTLAHLKAIGGLAAPLAVYLTDPSVHRLCISPLAQLTVAPNEIAADQAQRWGARRTVVARPLVAPEFRPPRSWAERLRARAMFGLPEGQRLALVVSGSWGVGHVESIAADVAASGQAVPVVVCGRNERLRERLTAAGFRFVLGWVESMPELMRACDVVVQNAGGLSTSEALATGLPVLTYRCLPGHGRANAAVLDAEGTVPWVRRRADLEPALTRALAAGNTEPARPAPVAEVAS